MPDATVVGAGPAGSVTALLLARAGWEVTLIEQHRFPRDKVCGECLSATGFDVLARLNLSDCFRGAGATPLRSATLHTRTAGSVDLQLPRLMWGLSRAALDQLLRDAARAAGARVRQPVRVEEVKQAEEGGIPGAYPCVRMRDLDTNRVDTIAPSWLILADGKGVFSPKAPVPTQDFGIKTHFADVRGPRDAIELFAVGGSYGGLAAIEEGRWNAAFSVPAAALRLHRGNVDALFAELTRENPALAQRLSAARRVGPWLAAPLPRFDVMENWSTRIVPVGNAAAAMEPIGGEGMGLALRSAERAAEALIRAKGDPAQFDGATLRHHYRQLWTIRRLACRVAALGVSGERTARLAADLLRSDEPIARLALRLIGK